MVVFWTILEIVWTPSTLVTHYHPLRGMKRKRIHCCNSKELLFLLRPEMPRFTLFIVLLNSCRWCYTIRATTYILTKEQLYHWETVAAGGKWNQSKPRPPPPLSTRASMNTSLTGVGRHSTHSIWTGTLGVKLTTPRIQLRSPASFSSSHPAVAEPRCGNRLQRCISSISTLRITTSSIQHRRSCKR